MCGRYIVVSKIEKIEKRFNVGSSLLTETPKANFNLSPGDLAPVITMEKSDQINMYRFGMRPFWSKKPMYLINARAEGNYNKDNDALYTGMLGLREKPSFRKPFKTQRCLVVADAFIEGTEKEKLNKPFVVYPVAKTDRPFAFAGLYDHYLDEETGEITSSFSIITSVATPLLQKIPHHRSPVVLNGPSEENVWLNKGSNLAELEALLRPPFEDSFNAYPIENRIKNSRLKDSSLIEPTGERLLREYDYMIHKDLELFGMGMTSSRKRKLDE